MIASTGPVAVVTGSARICTATAPGAPPKGHAHGNGSHEWLRGRGGRPYLGGGTVWFRGPDAIEYSEAPAKTARACRGDLLTASIRFRELPCTATGKLSRATPGPERAAAAAGGV